MNRETRHLLIRLSTDERLSDRFRRECRVEIGDLPGDLPGPLAATKEAADALLAPICAEVGRYLYDAPDEDLIAVLYDYGVKIPASTFKQLYDATDYDALR